MVLLKYNKPRFLSDKQFKRLKKVKTLMLDKVMISAKMSVINKLSQYKDRLIKNFVFD